jgi:hypothetical protein
MGFFDLIAFFGFKSLFEGVLIQHFTISLFPANKYSVKVGDLPELRFHRLPVLEFDTHNCEQFPILFLLAILHIELDKIFSVLDFHSICL